MLFVSLADACRRLGIDAKTLRRWLSLENFPLESHPRDGRLKGISDSSLLLLAHRHHRSLTSPSSEPAAPKPPDLPPLPAELLALPQQLASLQAQIMALQQQVAALTSLLTDRSPQPLQKPPASSSLSTATPSTHPPRSVARSRPAAAAKAKTPAKPVHVIPRVEYREDGHYVVICPKSGLLPFEPETPEWFAWVKEHDSFRFVGKQGYFSAHHEWRVKNGAWRAHRHIRNRVYVQRLAPAPSLTIAVLEQAAAALSAHLT
jgi:hypothetical protein